MSQACYKVPSVWFCGICSFRVWRGRPGPRHKSRQAIQSSRGNTDCCLNRALRYGVAMEPKEIIEAAGKTLAELADDPVKILLFGSRARGDAGPESDYDFLVVERDLKDRKAEMIRLRRALRPLGVPCDVLVVSERYAEEWGSALNSTMHSALTEGRVLHATA